MTRRLTIIIPSLLVLLLATLIFFNKSYQKSIYANYLFINGEYDEALRVAQESYILDPYNKMAKSIATKASAYKAYSEYIDLANRYLEKIVAIANRSPITMDERIEAKLMSEVVITRYEILIKTHHMEGELKDRAEELYKKFKEIYKNAF